MMGALAGLGLMVLGAGGIIAVVGWAIAMTFPGLGGQQPPPQNASPAGQLVPGIQAGTTGTIVASRVIIIGTGGELLVYSPTAGSGNLIASVSGTATTDSFGNTVEQGIAAYTTVSGITYALQLGQGDFGGTPFAGFFSHVISGATPAVSDPLFGGFGASTGSTAILGSGQSTVGATESGIQATDSVGSGVTGGEVSIVGGTCAVQGNITVGGLSNLLTGHASVTAPSSAPSITTLGSTWNATTASQCNQNFVNIVNGLGALGLFT